MSLSINSKWLLVVIGSTKYVQGDTRLQKYGLLVHKKNPDIKFYGDWEPGNYGGFSKSLASDTKTLMKSEFVISSDAVNSYGKKVARYRITDSGRNEIQDLLKEQEQIVRKICEITQYYFDKSLKEVLADVYTLYPQFTENSKIRPQVGKTQLELNSYLSPEFEIPFESNQKLESDVTNLITQTSSEFLFNDEDMREKLAKKIGLDEIPKLNPNAFEKLSGILHNKIKSEKIDSVDLVRTVRGS